jgi:hypothetical protein
MKCLSPGDSRRRSAIARAITGSSAGSLVILASLFLTGCPGTLDPGVGPGAGGSPGSNCDVPMILTSKCAFAGCHAATNGAAGLDLASADVPSRLVDHDTGTETGAACMGKKLLNANTNPATGVLVEKLTTPTCGGPMPAIGSLTATEKTCLLDWANSLTSTTAFTGGVSP